jgi:hypothetical protein
VGNYPITVTIGTVTTPGVELQEGVFTVEPATLTITAKRYTREEGDPNPEFEVTVSGYRNKETDTVFTVKPVITCAATKDSPVGEYDIVVSGAQARNYVMTYIPGKLTVVPRTVDIAGREVKETVNGTIYDMQGRPVATPRRGGIYIQQKRKVVK